MFAALMACSVLSIILLATTYHLSWQNIDRFLNSSTQDLSSTPTDSPHNAITLDDITITIKTTKRLHDKRISVLLRTWLKFALNQVRDVWLFVGEKKNRILGRSPVQCSSNAKSVQKVSTLLV